MGCGVTKLGDSPLTSASDSVPRTVKARGKSYDPHRDPKVRQLFSALGERLIWAISYEFYKRVEDDKEMPEFTEIFSTPSARASEQLCWFLVESWGGPHMYTTARGSHFAFLYSTHAVWRFQMTDKYWGRWIHHYLAAANHYCKQQSTHPDCRLVLPPISKRALEVRKMMKLPPIQDGVDEAPSAAVDDPSGQNISSCPFGGRLKTASADSSPQLPEGHPPISAIAHSDTQPADAYRVDPVNSGTTPAADLDAQQHRILPEHILTIEYYLIRLREWMDVPSKATLDKDPYVNLFD